jgi:hypothetical protein
MEHDSSALAEYLRALRSSLREIRLLRLRRPFGDGPGVLRWPSRLGSSIPRRSKKRLEVECEPLDRKVLRRDSPALAFQRRVSASVCKWGKYVIS